MGNYFKPKRTCEYKTFWEIGGRVAECKRRYYGNSSFCPYHMDYYNILQLEIGRMQILERREREQKEIDRDIDRIVELFETGIVTDDNDIIHDDDHLDILPAILRLAGVDALYTQNESKSQTEFKK